MSKPKAIFGLVERDWEEKIVVELDSALNTWIDTLPDHCTLYLFAHTSH